MKHLLLALCLAAAVADSEPGQPATAARDRVTVRGTWRADYDTYWTRNNNERWVSLELRYDDNNSGIGIPEREVPALGDRRSDGPIHFTLSRDAGRFDFTGEVSSGRGRGDFTFAPSADFVSGMQQLGYARLSDEDLWRFAVHDVTRTYVNDFKKAGYQLDSSELIKSRIHGATPAFAEQVKAEGYGRQEIDELVKMRIHGVTPEFVRELSDLGYKNLAIEDLVKMRIHGVTPDYIRKMKELGYPNMKVERLVQFRVHGVDEDLIRSAKAHGFNDLSADDLVDLAIHGRRWLKQ